MKKSILALATVVALAPAAALAQTLEPIRIGGNVQAPERTRYVPPVYPSEARAAGVSGIVIIEAVIGHDGLVTDAKVLKSVPLLDEPALDAVRQWRYAPTTLNGVAVSVIMTVTVKFTLDDQPAAPEPAVQNPAPTMPGPLGMSPLLEWKGAPPVRVGAQVTPPERVKYVPPVYPVDAQRAKVMGTVIVQAIIDEKGDVALAKVLKGVAGLDDAALDAVNQWKYKPTLMNGVPVPVMMTVTVNFSLRLQ